MSDGIGRREVLTEPVSPFQSVFKRGAHSNTKLLTDLLPLRRRCRQPTSACLLASLCMGWDRASRLHAVTGEKDYDGK